MLLDIILEKNLSHISYGKEIFKITESRRLSTKVFPILCTCKKLFEKKEFKIRSLSFPYEILGCMDL